MVAEVGDATTYSFEDLLTFADGIDVTATFEGGNTISSEILGAFKGGVGVLAIFDTLGSKMEKQINGMGRVKIEYWNLM